MFNYNLQNADWQNILKEQTADRAYDLSLNEMLTLYNETLPITENRIKQKSPQEV